MTAPTMVLSFVECVNAPTSECLSSPSFLFPFVMFAVLTGVGFLARRQSVAAFRRTRKRALQLALVLIGLSLALVAYFFLVDPETIKGLAASPGAEAVFMAALSGIGAALAFLFGAIGFAFGGWIAKKALPRTPRTRRDLVIAIDGPAASGKGTLAKRLAQHFGLPCLDTGLLYRAVARDVVERGGRLEDTSAAVAAARAIDAATLNDPALRGPAAGDAASLVAKIPEVRAALLAYQRAFAAQKGGAVLDGRDIGTVVCPDARIKIFVTASAEERARRRHLEHVARGEALSYETVLEDLKRRDARDSGRNVAPMEPARDAMRLDTTNLDADQAFAAAVTMVRGRLGNAG